MRMERWISRLCRRHQEHLSLVAAVITAPRLISDSSLHPTSPTSYKDGVQSIGGYDILLIRSMLPLNS
jgi:hypothetical protein